MRPSSPESTALRKRAKLSLQRVWKMQPSGTPAFSHAAIIASVRAVVMAIGFSTSTGTPCRAAAKTASSCAPLAFATRQRPTPGCASAASQSSVRRHFATTFNLGMAATASS